MSDFKNFLSNLATPAHEKFKPKDILDKQFPTLMAECLKNSGVQQFVTIEFSNPIKKRKGRNQKI